MESSAERVKTELTYLVQEGSEILKSEIEAHKKKRRAMDTLTPMRYQSWYTKALPVVHQLMLDRLREFQEQYRLDKRKEIDASTYTISDYLLGLRIMNKPLDEEVFDAFKVFTSKFQQQIVILLSAQTRIDSILADIKGILRAELFDSELEKARELLKKKHLRPAGTIASVVLEGHLSAVCGNHNVKFTKRDPNISDYNDALKKEGVYDTPTWRLIQRLADIRNLCTHKKEREPTKDEIDELIVGVEKMTRTIF